MNITTSTNIEAKVVTEEAVLFNNFTFKVFFSDVFVKLKIPGNSRKSVFSKKV